MHIFSSNNKFIKNCSNLTNQLSTGKCIVTGVWLQVTTRDLVSKGSSLTSMCSHGKPQCDIISSLSLVGGYGTVFSLTATLEQVLADSVTLLLEQNFMCLSVMYYA